MSDLGGPTARPGGLLAMLLAMGLIRQPEVVVTRSIAWLSSLPGARSAMYALIAAAGLEPDGSSSWHAEVRAADGARTDLECWWGDPPLPHVVVEAKLGALLTAHQIAAYITDLIRRLSGRDHDALVVVLVPEYRRSEASLVLDEARSLCGQPPARTAVWSYDQVLEALAAVLPGSGDLQQLQGFVEACEAVDVKPFTEDELLARAEDRQADLERVLDLATVSFFAPGERVLPSGRDRYFSWRRYLVVTPDGTNVAIGARDSSPQSGVTRSWAWLRVDPYTPRAETAGAALRDTYQRAYTDEEGSTWLPLDIPSGVAGVAMIAAVTRQIEDVFTILREVTL